MAIPEFLPCARFWNKDFTYFIALFSPFSEEKNEAWGHSVSCRCTKSWHCRLRNQPRTPKVLLFSSVHFHEKQQCSFNSLSNCIMHRILFFTFWQKYLLSKYNFVIMVIHHWEQIWYMDFKTDVFFKLLPFQKEETLCIFYISVSNLRNLFILEL